ncbi:MAG: hypothetical protein U9Q82_02580 [Chloroflexota bacterium]|nr:hypothetical protein [Chloroflexota bacterium]
MINFISFTFSHEAEHILLHGKRDVFLEAGARLIRDDIMINHTEEHILWETIYPNIRQVLHHQPNQ